MRAAGFRFPRTARYEPPECRSGAPGRLYNRPRRGTPRPRRRLAASRRAEADGQAPVGPVHRGPVARRRRARRAGAEREREARDDRRARRSCRDGGGGPGDHRRLSRGAGAARRRAARREPLGEADGLRPRGRRGSLPDEPRGDRAGCGRQGELREDRHGGLVDHRPHAGALSRAAHRRPPQRRGRSAGLPSAHRRRHCRPRERAALQGDLRRAAGSGVPGRGRDPRRLPALAGAARRRGGLRRDRDPRRAADRAVTRDRPRRRPHHRAVRVPDAARGAAGTGGRARGGGPPGAHLRPVRNALVRVLEPAFAGEPEARRVRGRRPARAGRPHPGASSGQASSEKPPSTINVWPRTISASGEHRKATAPAMSSGSTRRPTGFDAPDASISSRFGK